MVGVGVVGVGGRGNRCRGVVGVRELGGVGVVGVRELGGWWGSGSLGGGGGQGVGVVGVRGWWGSGV